MPESKDVAVIFKIDLEKGPSFAGIEEVNSLLAQGWLVTRIKAGGVTFKRKANDTETVKLLISGCDLIISLEQGG
jgi:hypothetical protein